MKRNIVFCALMLLIASCALIPKEPQPEPGPEKSTSLHEQKQPPPPLLLNGKLWLPTIIHDKTKSVMVLINAGNPEIQSGEKTKSKPVLPFYMDQYEVKAKEFSLFDPKYDERPYTHEHRPCPDCPAMGINWFRASEYCQWAGKRLPTEAEWDLAAYGPEHSVWPWGNAFAGKHANLHGAEDNYLLAAPVGSFPQGASSYGVLDMSGNVWEWVSDIATNKDDGKANHIVKGGGWTSSPESMKVSRRLAEPSLKNPTFGFRCVKALG